MRRIVFSDVFPGPGGRERREGGARGTHQPLVDRDRAAWEGRIKIGGRRSWRRKLGRGKTIIIRERIRVLKTFREKVGEGPFRERIRVLKTFREKVGVPRTQEEGNS